MPKRRVYRTEKGWLRSRSRSIGASESAAILGVGYTSQSAYTVWQQKCWPANPDSDAPTIEMRVGQIIEPALREIFRTTTGLDIRPLHHKHDRVVYQHDDHPWLRATLDAQVESERAVVELKNVGEHRGKEWGNNSVPLKFQVQVQHQMLVRGWHHGYVCALIGGRTPIVRKVEANERFQAKMLEKLAEFWQCVESREPPPIDGSYATREALARQHPTDDGTTVDLSADCTLLADRLDVLREEKRTIDDQIRAAENKLKAEIGDSVAGRLADGTTLAWTSHQRGGYTVDPTTYRRFRRLTTQHEGDRT